MRPDLFFVIFLLTVQQFASSAIADVRVPEALVVDGAPSVPDELVSQTKRYLDGRTARFSAWDIAHHSMLITTRFADTPQLHEIRMPMGARAQVTFEDEPIYEATQSPAGDVTLVSMDRGGNEFYQIYRARAGQLELLTDGKSRNIFGGWSFDGKLIGYTSTRRNGADTDVYIMDPRTPKSDHLVVKLNGEGWIFGGFSPDGARAVLVESFSATKSYLWMLDIKTGKISPIGVHNGDVAYGAQAALPTLYQTGGTKFSPDGALWTTSDVNSEFKTLGIIDPLTGRFVQQIPDKKWDVQKFAVSPDGKFVVYALNVDGFDHVKILDVATNRVRDIPRFNDGTIWSLGIAPWGEIGLSYTSAQVPEDVYSLDPRTLKARRWTISETGGLDPLLNAPVEVVHIKSFDGEEMSGLLYRPNQMSFPGRRPVIVHNHGGPESQWRAGDLEQMNYLINELGIAVFLPNQRGSSGYGKRFLALDDGPFRREDTVRDIGEFLDVLAKDPLIDPTRIGVSGGSYGGYMCYAVAIRFGERLRGADCQIGIANWVTYMDNTQPYRRDLRRVEYGDERDPKQRAKMLEISPLTRINELRIPMLIAQGANDPRVPVSESDQIAAAIKAHGGEVWYLRAKNEGHGFHKKENQEYYFWTEIQFWERNLLAH